MADNMNQDGASNGPVCETTATVNSGWTSKDLEILRSGLYADAEIICKHNISRKVHRNILASRSDWFKKAFSEAETQEGICKIKLEKPGMFVDLILSFLYGRRIDLNDEPLTATFGEMMTIMQVMRLGNFLGEKTMQDYGKDLLVTFLAKILDCLCDTSVIGEEKENQLLEQYLFPFSFHNAVFYAFDGKEPIPDAQRILADFASAARIYLFKCEIFVSFIEEQSPPAFGNLVLTSMLTGSLSGAFEGKWHDPAPGGREVHPSKPSITPA